MSRLWVVKDASTKGKVYPVPEVEVKDVSGAGDTFLAGLVSTYIHTKEIDKSIEFANQCATEAVSQKGVVSLSKIKTLLVKDRLKFLDKIDKDCKVSLGLGALIIKGYRDIHAINPPTKEQFAQCYIKEYALPFPEQEILLELRADCEMWCVPRRARPRRNNNRVYRKRS